MLCEAHSSDLCSSHGWKAQNCSWVSWHRNAVFRCVLKEVWSMLSLSVCCLELRSVEWFSVVLVHVLSCHCCSVSKVQGSSLLSSFTCPTQCLLHRCLACGYCSVIACQMVLVPAVWNCYLYCMRVLENIERICIDIFKNYTWISIPCTEINILFILFFHKNILKCPGICFLDWLWEKKWCS